MSIDINFCAIVFLLCPPASAMTALVGFTGTASYDKNKHHFSYNWVSVPRLPTM